MKSRTVPQFRKATAKDAAAIVTLVNSAYRGEGSKQGWTTEADLLGGQRVNAGMILETLEKSEKWFLLGEIEGRLVGSVLLEKSGAELCYFGMFAIDPTLQAKGIGRAMVAEAERFVRDDLGCQVMEMTVITVRSELIAWYERLGYKKTGEVRPFPYGDEKFGIPKRPDLALGVFSKRLL
jgi:ribosomal protein S18 acetylase RimI-like enzyme